ncbi:hypothetical protein BO71DRAFT_463348 [Aspergillus ellipticus CBS 707.79]|uniref:Uncharacterized protein n=1 Tax=Aspergillus ellipticus CBS 707.79 TaxID=1448320 RepID=A0A319DQT8_9EURO|nr:hypothetical protein BO71DRAFT_463348 [Aspergillus ellipticus CBS 707.79]
MWPGLKAAGRLSAKPCPGRAEGHVATTRYQQLLVRCNGKGGGGRRGANKGHSARSQEPGARSQEPECRQADDPDNGEPNPPALYNDGGMRSKMGWGRGCHSALPRTDGAGARPDPGSQRVRNDGPQAAICSQSSHHPRECVATRGERGAQEGGRQDGGLQEPGREWQMQQPIPNFPRAIRAAWVGQNAGAMRSRRSIESRPHEPPQSQ